jgi:uncharacterized protein (TIGR02453 family)
MSVLRQKVESTARVNAETFRFFRDLSRNNHKAWMDENRERYRSAVVQPLHALLEELTPSVHKLDPRFDVSGRTGVNFSRINRDIRFAKDKTPYRPQMYVRFPLQGGPLQGGPLRRGRTGIPGELYLGFTAELVTAGFRVYFDRETKAAALGKQFPQAARWCAKQKRRLARQFESYWYSREKGDWTKHPGWPIKPEEWQKLKAWVVRRKLSKSAAIRPGFPKDAAAIFRQVHPLLQFVSRSA